MPKEMTPISASWQDYIQDVYKPLLPLHPNREIELMGAYFAGAVAMLNTLKAFSNDESADSDEGVAALEKLHADAVKFVESECDRHRAARLAKAKGN